MAGAAVPALPAPHAVPQRGTLRLLLAGRWPEGWPQIYIRKKFVVIDPTIRYLGHAQRGFRWRDTLTAFRASPHRKRMERMMVDARQNGLEDGYLFPVHGRCGLVGSLSLGGRPVELESVEIGLFDSIARRLSRPEGADLDAPAEPRTISSLGESLLLEEALDWLRRQMEAEGFVVGTDAPEEEDVAGVIGEETDEGGGLRIVGLEGATS